MEYIQFFILGLSGLSVALSIVVLIKLKAVHYLLELPVVKKMSPALKLKPVKVDESDAGHKHDSRPAPANGNRAPGARPNFEKPEGGERQNREPHARQDRGPRPEGADRNVGGDRNPRNDRNDRNDRNFRDQNRGQRNDRNAPQGAREPMNREGGESRHGGAGAPGGSGGFDRNRNRNENHSNQPETNNTNDASAVNARPAFNGASENNSGGPTLAPRRPLPSTVNQEVSAKDLMPAEPVTADVAADAMFMRDDSEIQHGRRTQMKKKPKFDVSEEEIQAASTEETKV